MNPTTYAATLFAGSIPLDEFETQPQRSAERKEALLEYSQFCRLTTFVSLAADMLERHWANLRVAWLPRDSDICEALHRGQDYGRTFHTHVRDTQASLDKLHLRHLSQLTPTEVSMVESKLERFGTVAMEGQASFEKIISISCTLTKRRLQLCYAACVMMFAIAGGLFVLAQMSAEKGWEGVSISTLNAVAAAAVVIGVLLSRGLC